MTELNNISRIYFIGIGGIGMSALARHFNDKGVSVSGYDKTASVLSKELESEGMKIHYEDNIELIDKDADLVVYTPAIPLDHSEYNYYKNNNYKVLKRSDVLESLTAKTFNICVAGTHGKTTISSMIAHILKDSGLGCTAFLGGISVNYNTNYWSGENDICVVEADEYDRSFLKLSPNIAIISAMDADHLDIYGTAEAVEEAFIEFASRIKNGGTLISKKGLKREGDLIAPKKLSYSLEHTQADVYATNISIKEGCYHFDLNIKNEIFEGLTLKVGGMHNVENAVVAIATCIQAGVPFENIKKAIGGFKGVKRRFEYIVRDKAHQIIYIDDYAHHPEELKALISSAKNLFPDHYCIIIFQPHLYSRTRDLADDFATVLDMANEVVLLPLYPAREQPIEGVSSKMIYDRMRLKNKRILEMNEVVKWIELDNLKEEKRVYITAGAGNIDQLVLQIEKVLKTVE